MKIVTLSALFITLASPAIAQDTKEAPKKEVTAEQLKQLAKFALRGPIKKAQVTSAQAAMASLSMAIDGFYEEYQILPGGDKATVDKTIPTVAKNGSPLIAALLGLKSAQDENPKLISFFKFKNAKEKKDGIHRTKKTTDLYDPWGNAYHVMLNYDYDNQMKPPVGDGIVWDRRVLVWSDGPDGKSGTPETNADNVYSWRIK